MTRTTFTVGFGRRTRAPESAPAPRRARAPRPSWGLVAAADARSNDDVVAELARVAEEHKPDGGYGETAWNAETATVFWVSADWTSNEEADAAETAFLAVEGVDAFEYEAEAALPDGDGWEQVWPAATTAAGPAPEAPADGLLASAMKALVALAEKPAPEPAPITIQLPSHSLNVKVEPPQVPVTVEGAQVFVPEQPAPQVQVDVAAAPAPDVHVEVAPTPVQVDVAAPNVQVDVEVPRPRPIRVEEYEDGTRRYVPEEELDGEG